MTDQQFNDLFQRAAHDVDTLAPAIVDRAIATGRRRRTVRRLGTGVATLAVVAGVGAGAATLSGGHSGTTAIEPTGSGPASVSPSPSTPAGLYAGEKIDLGDGLTATIYQCNLKIVDKPMDQASGQGAPCAIPGLSGAFLGASSLDGSGTGYVALVTGPIDAIKGFDDAGFATKDFGTLTDKFHGLSILVKNPAAKALGLDVGPETKPASPTLAGWTCGDAGDDKFTCTGPDGKQAEFVWYPASAYADWSSGDPDKTSDWMSTVHNGVFMVVQVQGILNNTATVADAKALGESLVWK